MVRINREDELHFMDKGSQPSGIGTPVCGEHQDIGKQLSTHAKLLALSF